jgi:hypothetical protein
MKSEVYKTQVVTREVVFARITDAAANIKKFEDQLRRTKPDLHTRFAERTEVGGGTFEYLL